MDHSDIAIIRLISQQLIGIHHTTPKGIVSWMGAMQAQDFPMAKWAIGARLPGSTNLDIETAINNSEIIRTHLLRPTWHFVTPEDIYWLLALTAPQIKASQSARDRQLELTETIYAKSNSLIEKTLRASGQCTREELLATLNGAGIAIDQNRSAHLLMRAELEAIICSGPIHKGKPTYALLAERVPKINRLTKEEALAALARRYFASRCPATLQDFSWWSGLRAGDAREGLESIKAELHEEKIQDSIYWIPNDLSITRPSKDPVHLLPPFDEFIVGYTGRSASIEAKYASHMAEISNRGVFWPIIVINGQVIGIWKRTIQKDTIILDIQLFRQVSRSIQKQIEKSAAAYGLFMGKKVEENPHTFDLK